MTDLRPDATTPGREPVNGAEDIDLLERVRNAVLVLLAGLPRSPERLRIRAQDIVMELDWAVSMSSPAMPDAAPATPPDPGTNLAESGAAPTGPRITAPSVGTFYRSPEPGGDPFVQVGDQVKPGQQVAIVEAMKLMLPVEADTDGVITEVLAVDGQPVEYGQALFALGPVT